VEVALDLRRVERDGVGAPPDVKGAPGLVQRAVVRRDVAHNEGHAVEAHDRRPGRVEAHRWLAVPAGLQQEVDRGGGVPHPDDRPRPIRHAEDDIAARPVREATDARGQVGRARRRDLELDPLGLTAGNQGAQPPHIHVVHIAHIIPSAHRACPRRIAP